MKHDLYIHVMCRGREVDYLLFHLFLCLGGDLIPPQGEEGYLCPNKLVSWIFREFVNHVVQNITCLTVVIFFKCFDPA